MQQYLIKLPDKLSLKSADTIYGSTYNFSYGNQVVFSFETVSFIKPEALILLVTFSQYIYDKTGRIIIWKNVKDNVRGYLDRMNINDLTFVHVEHPFSFRREIYSKSDTLVELSTISAPDQIGSAIIQTKEILNRWFSSSHSIYRRHIATLIKETVENSVDHSSNVPSNGFCYYALQKYGHSDGTTEVQIAVGDIGIGMLASQRKLFPETKDDAEAIIEALMNGRSSRESGRGGMGYVNIREALIHLNGGLKIRSGKGYVEYYCNKDHPYIYRCNTSCPGTQIIFSCRA